MKISHSFKLLMLSISMSVIIVLTLHILVNKNSINIKPENSIEDPKLGETIRIKFFNRVEFDNSIKTQNDKPDIKSEVKGSILPHHLLASSLIAKNMKVLSKKIPKRIILIGPNHYERGDFKIITSISPWETELGILKGDSSSVLTMNNRLIGIDNNVLSEEHSVSGIMPFIKYFLPDAKVLPFIISKKISYEELQVFSNYLAKEMDKDTLIITSTDFSHYLKKDNANGNDVTTIELIKAYDFEKIFFLNNDYLDSPPSVIALLMVMKKVGAEKIVILDHKNSAEILNEHESETTSYYSMLFTR